MRNLVRVIEKDKNKIVQLFFGNFDSMEEIEERVPDKEAPAGDHQSVHNRLNDTEFEADRYFGILSRSNED